MKKTVKMLCLALAIVMLFAACGQGTTSSTPASSEATSVSGAGQESSTVSTASTSATGEGYAYEQNTEPVTLSIFVDSPGTLWETWGDTPVSQRITELTGISFECIAPVTDDDTKLQLLISSDDLPDIVTAGGSDTAWNTMVDQGMLADLEELSTQYAPKLFTELVDPEVADFCRQDDGTVRYLTSIYRTQDDIQWFEDHDYLVSTNQPVILIRQDYYEECGSPEVKSADEFMELCQQIKEKHPDTIPFYTGGLTSSGPSYLRYLFGPNVYYRDPETGRVSGSYRDPQYLEMYKWVNKMVNAGLMTEDSFVDTDVEKDSKSLAGQVASYVWTIGETGKIPADNANTQYYPMQPWDSYKQIRTNSGYIRFGISEKSENKDAAMRWFEFGNTKLGSQTMCWGVEGDPDAEFSGDVVNGPHFFFEENGEKATLYPGFQEARNADWSGVEKQSGIGFYHCYVSTHDTWAEMGEITGSDLMKEMNEWYAPRVEYNNGFIFNLPADSDEYVINQQITTLISEYNVQWAFAKDEEEVESLYNEFLGKVEALGEEKLIDWYTAAYEENVK